jgi:O-antigen ligase
MIWAFRGYPWACLLLVLTLLVAALGLPDESLVLRGFVMVCLFVGMLPLVRDGVGAGRRAAWPLLLISLWFLVLAGIYVLNHSHDWASGGAMPVPYCAWLPASSNVSDSLGALHMGLMLLAMLALGRQLGQRQITALGWGLIAGSSMMALVVLGQRLTPKPYPVFELTGLFRYENHYAAFANMTLPLALFWGLRQRIQELRGGSVSSPFLLYVGGACLIGSAVLLSGSRAGILISFLVLLVFAAARLVLGRRYPILFRPVPRVVRTLIGPMVVAALTCGFLVYLWPRMGSGAGLASEISFRLQVLQDTVSMWLDRPLWGTGPGTFASVFPYYQSSSIETHYLKHAHCDPLEFLAEYGILGVLSLLAVVGTLFIPIRGMRFGNQRLIPAWFEIEGLALILALLTIALHGMVDFPFRHPLNTLLAALFIAIVSRASGSSERVMNE